MLHTQWRHQLKNLRDSGNHVGPRGFATRELLDQRFVFDSRYCLLDAPARALNYRFAVAEFVWMMFGHSAVEPVAQFNSVMREFSDDGVWLTGAYGPHIKAQWRDVTEKLRRDPDTRQAVIEIPRPRRETKDEPCTLSFQFLNRYGALNMIVTMRSSDAWLGIPYDSFTFAMIQNCMAGELGIPRGWLSLHTGSSHLYERDLDAAKLVLADDAGWTMKMPDLPGRPPAGLEDILLKRDVAAVPAATSPWHAYARVLLSNTSDEARDILRAL